MTEYLRWPSSLSSSKSNNPSHTEVLNVGNIPMKNVNMAPIQYIESAASSSNDVKIELITQAHSSSKSIDSTTSPPPYSASTPTSSFSYSHPSLPTSLNNDNNILNPDDTTSIFLSIDGKFEKIDLSKENCAIFKEYIERIKSNIDLRELSDEDKDTQELWVIVKPCNPSSDEPKPKDMYLPNRKAPAAEHERTSLIDDEDDEGFVVVHTEDFQQSLGELVSDVLFDHYHPKATIFNRLSSKISSKFVTVNVPPPHELRTLLIRALSQSNSFTSERVQSALSAGKYAYFAYGWTSTIYWLTRQPWISGIVIAGAAKLADCALMLLL